MTEENKVEVKYCPDRQKLIPIKHCEDCLKELGEKLKEVLK